MDSYQSISDILCTIHRRELTTQFQDTLKEQERQFTQTEEELMKKINVLSGRLQDISQNLESKLKEEQQVLHTVHDKDNQLVQTQSMLE